MNVLKVWVWSDLHLELDEWEFPARLPRADVAVVAGDLHRLPDAVDWLVQRLDAGVLKVRRVVYVPGNHEYYRREMTEALSAARSRARDYGIDLLDMDEVEIGGVRFLGGTLWTDFALDGDFRKGMINCRVGMNDGRFIGIRDAGEVRALQPEDTQQMHAAYLDWLIRKLETPFAGPTVVVTHHAPSRGSLHPRYVGDTINPGFISDLSWLIERYQPDLWIHGHVHDGYDYRIGRTRVLCNPKGYGTVNREENSRFKPRLVVKIETGAES